MIKVSNLLQKHREELGTRNGTRALTCWQQAKFILAWFRDKPGIRRLGQGSGISQATAYRCKDEGIKVLKAKAPTLHEALENAAEQGLPYLILDATLISADRCTDKKTSRKGALIDKWYSGKAHEHAGLVQGLIAPSGIPLWLSDVLPGSTHDITAARQQVLPAVRPYLKNLPILADSGCEGAGPGVHVPVKKPRKGELDIDTITRNTLLRSLRYQGERGFAVLKERWRALGHVTTDPASIGPIAMAALVLTQIEHKMIS
ncbi:MAG: transposase family protein [Trebonia sp.]